MCWMKHCLYIHSPNYEHAKEYLFQLLYCTFYIHTLFHAVPSGPPINIQHAVQSATTLSLSWSSPRDDEINGVILHYSITLNDTTSTRTVAETFTTFSNLHPFYIYEYSIAAFTIGLGPYSATHRVQMPQARKLEQICNYYLSFHYNYVSHSQLLVLPHKT